MAAAWTTQKFLSVLMSLAYALLTRFDIGVHMIALQKILHKPQYVHVRNLKAVVRWSQTHQKKLSYLHMTCDKRLEIHADTGFRREATEEGDVDGDAPAAAIAAVCVGGGRPAEAD